MAHPTLAVTPETSRGRRWRKVLSRLLLATIAVLVVLVFDFSPSVPEASPPTAEQARGARDLASRTKAALDAGNGFALISADRNDLKGASALANALGQFVRVEASIVDTQLLLQASRRLGPVWLNGRAIVDNSKKGFPETRLSIGGLPLGATLSRWIIEQGRSMARRRGADVPPLNDLIRWVTIKPDLVVANVHLPLKGRFANSLSKFRNQPINARETAAIYCALRRANRTNPTDRMDLIVRRAFNAQTGTQPGVETNRATFVALAMYVADPSVGRLAGNAAQRSETCKGSREPPRLSGRADLAAHWTISAALSVALGDDIGRAMGEWKELSDSRPGGSGFSFVDLAADRAGLDAARRATDPSTAGELAAQMRVATPENLLPIRALALAEGLSESAFITRYNNIESAQFDAAKARIDGVIAQNRSR